MSQLLIWGISATPNRPLFVENIFRYNKKIQHRGPYVVVSFHKISVRSHTDIPPILALSKSNTRNFKLFKNMHKFL